MVGSFFYGFIKLTFCGLGFMRITDLGIARVWNPENAKDTSGTPGYMGKFDQLKLLKIGL